MLKCVIQSEFAPNAAMKKRENMSTVLFVTPTIHPRLEDEPLGTLILATIVRQHVWMWMFIVFLIHGIFPRIYPLGQNTKRLRQHPAFPCRLICLSGKPRNIFYHAIPVLFRFTVAVINIWQ